MSKLSDVFKNIKYYFKSNEDKLLEDEIKELDELNEFLNIHLKSIKKTNKQFKELEKKIKEL